MKTPLIIVIISVFGPVAGSALGVLRKPSFTYICNMLCFAAGVMLAISFLELIPEAIRMSRVVITSLGFVAGSLFMYGLDRLIPHIHPRLCQQEQGCNLERTAVYLFLGMFLHNFPEGMAIAAGEFAGTGVSLAIALAISVHGIPEGICTSAPYYHSTGKRLKAFLLSSSTAVPILLGYLTARFIYQDIPLPVIGFITAATAGLMVYITVDELIPSSCAGDDHKTIFSLITGILFVMLLGLLE